MFLYGLVFMRGLFILIKSVVGNIGGVCKGGIGGRGMGDCD